MLQPNDVVPADARLLVTDSLEVDESPLTGESLPVAKDATATVAAHLAERFARSRREPAGKVVSDAR